MPESTPAVVPAPAPPGTATPPSTVPAPSTAPTIDALHRDIAFANSYRLELIKLVMTLSAALLAFTVTFRPELQLIRWPEAMWISWGGLALAMIGGMVHMHGWDRYYASYRDFDYTYRNQTGLLSASQRGKRARKTINRWRRAAMLTQYAGFAVGVAGVAWFAGANVDGKHAIAPSAAIVAPVAAISPHPAAVPASNTGAGALGSAAK